MKVLNFGSLNYDYVYSVDHIVKPGETISSGEMKVFCGGKGFNQSAALAKAGVPVLHAGMVGEDKGMFMEACTKYGIDTRLIKEIQGSCGHAIIQVDKNAQNSIVIFGGSNQKMTKEYIDSVLDHFDPGDLILLQNEINLIHYIIDKAYEKNMVIAFNPSPYDYKIKQCDLKKVSVFLVNEVEGEQITGEKDSGRIMEAMRTSFPTAKIVLTLGSEGVMYFDGRKIYEQEIVKVKAVDTTAAGDTFTGYYISSLLSELAPEEALEMCTAASALTVSRQGAAPSIPVFREVEEFIGR